MFVAIFGVSALLRCLQGARIRTWYMVLLVIGGACETIGYIRRISSAHEAPDFILTPYIIQSTLQLFAPALMSASVYMILGYINVAVKGEARSPIRRKFLTLIFVLGDIWSFLVQSTGNLARNRNLGLRAGKTYSVIAQVPSF